MADNPAATESPTPPASTPQRSGLLSALKIGAFVIVVLSVECLIALLFLPSSSDVSAMAEARVAAENRSPEAALLNDLGDQPSVEVDLQAYSLAAYQPLSSTTLRIDFHLHGTVIEEDQADFDKTYLDKQKRLHEQVEVIIRSSELTDLTDPGLALIKRKILEKANRTLGKPLLKSIVISDFSFIEQ